MFQQKAFAFIFSTSLIFTLFYYYKTDGQYSINLEPVTALKRKPIYLYNDSEDYLINTSGCYIPNYGKKIKFLQIKDRKQTCGQRAIFVKKINDKQIVFQIDQDKMKKYIKAKDKYECCYMFATRSNIPGKEDTHISYTTCEPFTNGSITTLSQEVITVRCSSQSKSSRNIYQDAYMVLKKDTQIKNEKIGKNWNVLLLGMDTMSRARILNTMPQVVKYMKNHDWLDYKGYQKVGYNTFPNLVSFLTGMNESSIYSVCNPNMYSCNERMIWSKFRKAGYITAYGEDYLRLPDTFFRHNGFKSIPTHHYMRPFFLTGEYQAGNVICTKHLPSGKHILDYAYDFAETYKNDSFFGLFWINSYSHNEDNIPTLFENYLLDFLNKTSEAGILNNTIIVLFSDHGIRYGPLRTTMEYYYEERLPMLFVWVPNEFRTLQESSYYNLQQNQNRLVTPYDLYKTLVKISNFSVSSADITSDACPLCNNLFEEISPHRTCPEAGVSEKWCSCHTMTPINKTTDNAASISLDKAVLYVQNKTKTIKTINCMKCHMLELEKVYRIHLFKNGNRTFYEVAFEMKPGKVIYEATVLKNNNTFSVTGGVDALSSYNVRGNCVINPNDRMYCVCKRAECTK